MEKLKKENENGHKAAVTLPGTVEKLIHPIAPNEPEKAQISVEGADELYREIRVENTLRDKEGNIVALKEGAEVEVTIEADSEATSQRNIQNQNNSQLLVLSAAQRVTPLSSSRHTQMN